MARSALVAKIQLRIKMHWLRTTKKYSKHDEDLKHKNWPTHISNFFMHISLITYSEKLRCFQSKPQTRSNILNPKNITKIPCTACA